MTRQNTIYLLAIPFLFISCSGLRDAVDNETWPEAEKMDPEPVEEVAILPERMGLLDSLVYLRANEALNHFLLAQREASRGNFEDALDYAVLSLQIHETADAMIFKSMLLAALGREEEAAYWYEKAGERGTGNGELRTENGELGTESGELGTESGELRTGSWELGTEN